jgi:hypothetical protein
MKKKIKKTQTPETNDKSSEIRTFQDLLTYIKENKAIVGLIFAFTLLIYANIITGKFVNLDDLSVALKLPIIQDFKIAMKARDGHMMITSATYHIFGESSSAFHVQSIIMHMINGVLVFSLLRILFDKRISIIGTFLFLAHPANTEAVSWHAGQIYVVRANLIIPTLIFFALYRKSGSKKYLIISSLIYLVGMIFFQAQGWMFITPFLLVLMDQFLIEKKIIFKNIKFYLPILITSLIFAALLLPGFYKGRVEDLNTLYYVNTDTATPLINRIPYIVYMEFRTLFYPRILSIYHEGAYISSIEYSLMIVVTLAVISGIFYFLKKDMRVSGLLLMILFSILPSFSPVIIAWLAAERYLYIPTIFSSTLIALFLIWVEERINKNNKNEKTEKKNNFVTYSFLIILALYSIRTVVRNVDLRNSKNLWIATRKTAPYSYRVYNNMGDVLASEGDLDGALENFKRSVALKPDYADAVHNIGHIYMVKKDYPQAIFHLQKSLDMNPRLYPSAYKLGIIYIGQGDYEKARSYFEKCLEFSPDNPECVQGISTVDQLILQKTQQ